MSLYELHVEIWKLTLARSLTTHGATIKMLRTHALRDSSAIGLFRKTSVLLSLFLGLAVTVLSFNFHWYPVPTKILTDICNPVTYPEILKSDLVGLSSLMEGTASFARLDSYGIPLADGLIIGISSWPLVAPKEIFSAETQGYAGAVRVVCGQEEGAKERMNETTITSGKVERVDNHMHGIMDIYYPPDTFVKLGPGYELGLTQKCTWDIKIGQATVDGAFGADDWNMVAIGRLSGVRAGDFKISSPADDHKGEHPLFTYDQVASHLQGFHN